MKCSDDVHIFQMRVNTTLSLYKFYTNTYVSLDTSLECTYHYNPNQTLGQGKSLLLHTLQIKKVRFFIQGLLSNN